MITTINVIVVDEANQQRLLELLTAATRLSVRQATGFISARLLRSTDGRKSTVYAEWDSSEAYMAKRRMSGPSRYLEEIATIATFDPGMYEIVELITPAAI